MKQRTSLFADDITNAHQERRQVQTELLRQSIRNSQKMRALKEVDISVAAENASRLGSNNVTGTWNPAFSDEMVEGAKPTLSDVVDIVNRLSRDAGFLRLASGDASTSHALKTIAGLSNDPAFQRSLAFAHKVRQKTLINLN